MFTYCQKNFQNIYPHLFLSTSSFNINISHLPSHHYLHHTMSTPGSSSSNCPTPKSSTSATSLEEFPENPPGGALSPIAIIGIGCRFPGDATSPSKLWDMLSNARDAWSRWPAGRFNSEAFYHPHVGRSGSVSLILFLICKAAVCMHMQVLLGDGYELIRGGV